LQYEYHQDIIHSWRLGEHRNEFKPTCIYSTRPIKPCTRKKCGRLHPLADSCNVYKLAAEFSFPCHFPLSTLNATAVPSYQLQLLRLAHWEDYEISCGFAGNSWTISCSWPLIVKINFTLEQATKVQKVEYRCSSTLSLTSALYGVGGQHYAPAALSQEGPVTPCIGGWVVSRTGLYVCGKSCPPQGFDPRTVQPVASRYTDWVIPAQVHDP
jgi:hypothetical protein